MTGYMSDVSMCVAHVPKYSYLVCAYVFVVYVYMVVYIRCVCDM